MGLRLRLWWRGKVAEDMLEIARRKSITIILKNSKIISKSPCVLPLPKGNGLFGLFGTENNPTVACNCPPHNVRNSVNFVNF